VALTPDGRYGVSGCKDGTLQLWNLEGSERLRIIGGFWFRPLDETGRMEPFNGHTGRVTALAVTPDGLKIAALAIYAFWSI
jgi:WD40 repeat protein